VQVKEVAPTSNKRKVRVSKKIRSARREAIEDEIRRLDLSEWTITYKEVHPCNDGDISAPVNDEKDPVGHVYPEKLEINLDEWDITYRERRPREPREHFNQLDCRISKKIYCYNCGRAGHIERNCRSRGRNTRHAKTTYQLGPMTKGGDIRGKEPEDKHQ